MKHSIFLFLISITAFSQNHHFKVDSKELICELTFKSDASDILKKIDTNHPKINLEQPGSLGTANNLSHSCVADYLDNQSVTLNLNFEVFFENGNYTVIVYNLITLVSYEDSTDYLGKYPLTKSYIDKKTNLVTTNKHKMEYLDCLDLYLIKLFKIENAQLVN